MPAQPIAHSAVLIERSPMIGLLGDNRLTAGHETLVSFCGPQNTAKQPLRPVNHRGVSTVSKTVPYTA